MWSFFCRVNCHFGNWFLNLCSGLLLQNVHKVGLLVPFEERSRSKTFEIHACERVHAHDANTILSAHVRINRLPSKQDGLGLLEDWLRSSSALSTIRTPLMVRAYFETMTGATLPKEPCRVSKLYKNVLMTILSQVASQNEQVTVVGKARSRSQYPRVVQPRNLIAVL